MSNLFDVTNYPEGMPERLVVGDRWAWKRTDLGVDYPPASYTLSYSLRLASAAATEIEVDATASGSDFVAEVDSTTTAGYTAGTYHYQAYITRDADSERLTLESGVVEVLPNRDAAGTDPRSHARVMVDNLQSALQASSTTDVVSYSIGGRSVTRAREEVRRELLYWQQVAAAEEAAEERRAGKPAPGRIVRARLS